MAFKFVALTTLLAVANAGFVPYVHNSAAVASFAYAQPAAYAVPVVKAAVSEAEDLEHDSHPKYKFSYSVNDEISGDSKSQEETRDGDVVKGSYSVMEADGTRRVVHYSADDVNGFNAVVEKQPAAVAPVVHAAPVAVVEKQPAAVAPVVHAAPVAVVEKQPVAVAPVVHAAPIAVKTVAPVVHAVPVHYQTAAVYKSAPIAVKTVAPVHVAPVVYKSAEIYQAAPVYQTAAVYKVAPVATSYASVETESSKW